jgi:hypothetical protein
MPAQESNDTNSCVSSSLILDIYENLDTKPESSSSSSSSCRYSIKVSSVDSYCKFPSSSIGGREISSVILSAVSSSNLPQAILYKCLLSFF